MRASANFDKNNFDCLRLLLALIVVLLHLSVLTNLPAFSALGRYCSAHFAVRSFFAISGLLIYRSYLRSSSLATYLEKRARRVYPAYFTVIVLAAISLYPLSGLSASHYFGIHFWKYLGANLLFLNFVATSLPGVFTSNSLPEVNGALWTLKIEVVFYLFVPLMHRLCMRFGTKKTIGTIILFSCAWKYGFAWMDYRHSSRMLSSPDSPRTIYSQLAVQFPAQLVYFSAGILLLLYFDRLKCHFGKISAMTACFFLLDHFVTADMFDVLWIPGLVFVFGFWRYFGRFSKYGDFSYGIYIVHWPLLQTMISLGFARLSPILFLLLSLSIIGLTSLLMWHLVESSFLTSGSHYKRVVLIHPNLADGG